MIACGVSIIGSILSEPSLETVLFLEHFEEAHRGVHLLRHLNLRHRDDEIFRQFAAGRPR